MRQQHHAPPANNPVGSTGTNFQYSPHFQQPSPNSIHNRANQPLDHLLQSLMVNNLQYQQSLQGQPRGK